jgi:hypothetical protein
MAQKSPIQSIASVRTRIHSTTTNYPDDTGIEHYNRIYKKVISKMRLLDDDYFYQQGKSATAIDQQEYTINTIGVTDITRVKTVSVKFTADQTYYTPCREVSADQLPYGKDYYAVNQPKTDPIYYIQDQSIWIFPVSDVAVTDGLFIEAIIQPPSLLTSDTADRVVVPERVNEVIEDGMMPFALEHIGKINYQECMTLYTNFIGTTLNDVMGDLSLRGK